jgi:phosphoribosylglycinamide formyltransferase-1
MGKLRIGALISGGGSNLQAIIDACEAGRIKGEVAFVGSDNPKAFGLERAKKHKIDTFTVDYASIIRSYRQHPEKASAPEDFDLAAIAARQTILPAGADAAKLKAFLITRAIAEAELLKKMEPYPYDLLILAGFMRNLTPYFIDRVNAVPDESRIMNIHPALLPAFPGVDGYGDTFRYGSKVGGCTVHFIDYGEDSGPIIGQRAFQIDEEDTLESVKAKGLELEWQLYPECIRLFAEGRLKTVKMTYKKNGEPYQRTVVKISGK